jgi:hypothetical protein
MNSQSNPMGVAMTPAQYAEEWSTSARNFAASNDYQWMASVLPKGGFAVEVGCGSGQSTLAILTTYPAVLAIDNNDHLVQMACATLAKNGVSASVVSSGNLPVAASASFAAQILQASILDAGIDQAVQPSTLDAMTVWLMGATPGIVAEALGKPTEALVPGDMPGYRERVQARCIELARAWLKPKGVLHLVDRAVIGSWNDKDQFRSHWAAQYQVTAGADFVVAKSDVMFRKIGHVGKSKIQHVASSEAAGAGQAVLTSILFHRAN